MGSLADQVFRCSRCDAFPEDCAEGDCCCEPQPRGSTSLFFPKVTALRGGIKYPIPSIPITPSVPITVQRKPETTMIDNWLKIADTTYIDPLTVCAVEWMGRESGGWPTVILDNGQRYYATSYSGHEENRDVCLKALLRDISAARALDGVNAEQAEDTIDVDKIDDVVSLLKMVRKALS